MKNTSVVSTAWNTKGGCVTWDPHPKALKVQQCSSFWGALTRAEDDQCGWVGSSGWLCWAMGRQLQLGFISPWSCVVILPSCPPHPSYPHSPSSEILVIFFMYMHLVEIFRRLQRLVPSSCNSFFYLVTLNRWLMSSTCLSRWFDWLPLFSSNMCYFQCVKSKYCLSCVFSSHLYKPSIFTVQ